MALRNSPGTSVTVASHYERDDGIESEYMAITMVSADGDESWDISGQNYGGWEYRNDDAWGNVQGSEIFGFMDMDSDRVAGFMNVVDNLCAFLEISQHDFLTTRKITINQHTSPATLFTEDAQRQINTCIYTLAPKEVSEVRKGGGIRMGKRG